MDGSPIKVLLNEHRNSEHIIFGDSSHPNCQSTKLHCQRVNLELIFKDAYPNLSSRLYIEIKSNKNEEEEKCCKTFGSKN